MQKKIRVPDTLPELRQMFIDQRQHFHKLALRAYQQYGRGAMLGIFFAGVKPRIGFVDSQEMLRLNAASPVQDNALAGLMNFYNPETEFVVFIVLDDAAQSGVISIEPGAKMGSLRVTDD